VSAGLKAFLTSQGVVDLAMGADIAAI